MIDINVEPVNINGSQELFTHMEELFQGIDKYNDMAVNADVYIKSLDETPTNLKEISIRVNMPGKDIFVAKQGADYKAAAQEVLETLKVSLKRHKDIHKDNHQVNPI